MRKKIIYVLLALVIATTSLTGCKKKEAEVIDNQPEQTVETTVSGNNETETEKSDFSVENKYVKVADYENIEAEPYEKEITDSDIESYINFALSAYYSKIDMNGYIPYYNDLTDKMVSEITDGEYTTIEEYKVYVKDMLEKQAFSDYEEQTKDELFNNVIENSELITYEDEVYERYHDYVVKNYNEYAQYFADGDIEAFYTESLGLKSEEEYNDFLKQEALKNIKIEYVIHTIAEKENITVSDEEVENEIQNYLNNGYFATEEDLFEYMTLDEIRTNIQYYKIRDFIYNNAINK